jgi:hypothetical protein
VITVENVLDEQLFNADHSHLDQSLRKLISIEWMMEIHKERDLG